MATTHKSRFLTSEERETASLPLRPLAADYLEDLEISGRSPLTVKHYRSYLGAFVEWLAFQTGRGADALVTADVTEERLRMYLLHLARKRDRRSGRPIAAPTRNLYVTALRELLEYGRRRRKLDLPDPAETLPRAKERDVEIRHLDREEVERLREAVDLSQPTGLRDRAVIEALFGSGVRVSELANLTVRALDLDRREVEVIGKGAKSRLVIMTEEAAMWIGRYLGTRTDDSAALFVTTTRPTRPLGVRQIQRIVERAAERARIPFKVSPHWLRHSRLTVLARHAGVQVAQRIAGHSSLQTTSRYLHITDSQLRAAYDEAEKKDRSGR